MESWKSDWKRIRWFIFGSIQIILTSTFLITKHSQSTSGLSLSGSEIAIAITIDSKKWFVCHTMLDDENDDDGDDDDTWSIQSHLETLRDDPFARLIVRKSTLSMFTLSMCRSLLDKEWASWADIWIQFYAVGQGQKEGQDELNPKVVWLWVQAFCFIKNHHV